MNVVLTVISHTASMHRGGGSIQGENRILGQFLDSAFCFGRHIQEQTEIFRHRGCHSTLRHRAGNRLVGWQGAWTENVINNGRIQAKVTKEANITWV